MCDLCNVDFYVDVTLTDKDGSKVYCPNHLTRELGAGRLNFIPDKTLVDEITRKPGAVKFQSADETYILNPGAMRRLINRSLRAEELEIILKDRGLTEIPDGSKYFQIHNDFYDEKGLPLQVCLTAEDLRELYPKADKQTDSSDRKPYPRKRLVLPKADKQTGSREEIDR